MAEEEKKSMDPMEMAIDLLFGTITNLDKSSMDPQAREATRNILEVVKATALIELADSLNKSIKIQQDMADSLKEISDVMLRREPR